MEHNKSKKNPNYGNSITMLCAVYAFNEKSIQLKEKHISLFLFSEGFLEITTRPSVDSIKDKYPHLDQNNIKNSALLDLFLGIININSLSYILHNEITKNPALKFENENIINSIRTILSQTLEHQKNSGFNQLIIDLVFLTKEQKFFEQIAKINKNKPKYSQLNSIIEHALLEFNVPKSNKNIKKVKI